MRLMDFPASAAEALSSAAAAEETGVAATAAAVAADDALALEGAALAAAFLAGADDGAAAPPPPPPPPGVITSVNWLAISDAPQAVFMPAIATPLPKMVVVWTPSTIGNVPLHLGQRTL